MPAADSAPRLVLLMGVAGSGKTTIGMLLADRLAYTFLDADTFHSPDAIARMRSGIPLTADMRASWVNQLELVLRGLYQQHTNCVLAFSGLHARHRRQLMRLDFTTFAFMLDGSEALLGQRLGLRGDHFMPRSQLRDQLVSMEPLQPDEQIETLDIRAQPRDLVAALAEKLAQSPRQKL